MRALTTALLLTALSCVVLVASAPAVTPPSGFRDSLVCAGLPMPVAMAFLPGPAEKASRLLVVGQKQRAIELIIDGVRQPPPPLGQISEVDWVQYGERGVLSLAVDPRWPAQPYVYLHYTSFGAIHLVRYRMTGDLAFAGAGFVSADTTTKMYLLNDVPDANVNHNGGCLRFGPDGMLYFSTGDDELSCPAQDSTSLAGKVLRLDVTRLPENGPGPAPRALLAPADNPYAASPDSNARLVWARGLRNPFRMHFDPVDGALFVDDVGQVTYEEVNRITGPSNLGWPWYENTTRYPLSCGPVIPSGLTVPIATLVNPPNASIVSLGVYRAPALASNPYPAVYDGDYFYSDYFSGLVKRLGWDGSAWSLEPALGQPGAEDWGTGAPQVVDGAIGPDGSLWYLLHGINYGFTNGQVRRIVYVGGEDTVTAVGPRESGGPRLAAPRPNPARGAANFSFTLASPGEAELDVFDAAGRRVITLARGEFPAGEQRAHWDGRDADGHRVAPGVYRVRLRAAGANEGRAFVLLP
jgi:glucose/arabinose dehydrogenase